MNQLMTELELLQQKHREEAAQRRAKLKERKKRTHRLIERGAILESVLKEIVLAFMSLLIKTVIQLRTRKQ